MSETCFFSHVPLMMRCEGFAVSETVGFDAAIVAADGGWRLA